MHSAAMRLDPAMRSCCLFVGHRVGALTFTGLKVDKGSGKGCGLGSVKLQAIAGSGPNPEVPNENHKAKLSPKASSTSYPPSFTNLLSPVQP